MEKKKIGKKTTGRKIEEERLNDNNQKLLNDRMKWKMQKKNIQESKQKTLWQ